jgi:hypothetical protein
MVEGMEGGGETDSITAASAAYLNKQIKLTANPLRGLTATYLCRLASAPDFHTGMASSGSSWQKSRKRRHDNNAR